MDPSKRADLAKTFSKARESVMKSDTATFLGFSAPAEVTQMCNLLPKIERPIFIRLLKFVMEYLKGTKINEETWAKLREATQLPANILSTVFSGLVTLLRRATRMRVEQAQFKQDLSVLTVPVEYINDLAAFVDNWRNLQDAAYDIKHVKFPGLENMKFRVDVTIMSSSMNRVLKPSVLMQLTNTEGKTYTFEMTPAQFHKLRYSTARLIKELDNVDKTPILTIDRVKPQ